MLSILKKASAQALRDIKDEMRIRKTTHFILLFSMGSQFDHLIVRELGKLGVFCVIADPAHVKATDVRTVAPSGIIVSGGPASVHSEPPPFDKKIFDLGIPTLGVCLGFQMWAKHIGAKVTPHEKREFGVHTMKIVGNDPLFRGVRSGTPVLQTHGDAIEKGSKIKTLGSTDNSPVTAGTYKHLWGVQFHPEVTDTKDGSKMYANFCFTTCGITDRFPAHSVAKQKIAELQTNIAGRKVLIALSGGSDSSVVAYLLKHAAGRSKSSLRGVYIRGIDRPDDEAFVKKYFGKQA